MESLFLNPSEIHVTNKPLILKTLLGSCVAVCLWDKKLNLAGMCHYVSAKKGELDADSYFFGDMAIEALIGLFKKNKSDLKNIEAKIYGGANVLKDPNIGQKCCDDNIHMAHEILNKNKIPIIESNIGGTNARNIFFNTETFKVENIFIKYQDFSDEIFDGNELRDLLLYIYQKTGIEYKTNSKTLILYIKSSIKRLKLKNLTEYLGLIKTSAIEESLLINKVTTHSTEWFRDPMVYENIKSVFYHHLQRNLKRVIRIISIGCSTGEEPYSLAFILWDLKKRFPDFKFELHAVDLDPMSLEAAKKGIYPRIQLKNIPKEYAKFVDVYSENYFQVVPTIRDSIQFQIADIRDLNNLKGPFDIILARNILVYFSQKNINLFLSSVYQILSLEGDLFLGKKETIEDHRFSNTKNGHYKKIK